jgi:hypothetical protein
MNNTDPHQAINHIFKTGKLYAEAKAKRVYLDQFRKSKKAILIQQAPKGTGQDRECFAYAHDEYLEILVGLRDAVELEEKYRFELKAAELRVEIYRTEQANSRMEYSAAKNT